MNKAYFKYLYKSNQAVLIFVLVIFAALSMTPLMTSDVQFYNVEQSLYFSAFLAICLSFVFPILLFAFIHKRKSSDMMLALPMNRKEILITSLSFSLSYIMACTLITDLIVYSLFGHNFITGTIFFSLLVYLLISIIELLLIHTAIFLIANNLFDGIALLAAYSAITILIFIFTEAFNQNLVAGYPDYTICLYNYFSPTMMHIDNCSNLLNSINFNWSYLLVSTIITFISAYLLKLHFISRQSERAEQLSDGKLAYPFIINFYAFALLSTLNFYQNESWIWIAAYHLMILIAYVIAEFIYKRSIKLSFKLILRYIMIVILSLIVSFIGWHTEGFTLARQYPKTGKLNYNYSAIYASDFSELDGLYDESTLDVYFTAHIPAKRNKEKVRLYNMMEAIRSDCIDDFYANKDHINISNSYLYVDSGLTKQYDAYFSGPKNQYSYDCYLNKKQLIKINKYTTVYVTSYDKDGNVDFDGTLDEYLER